MYIKFGVEIYIHDGPLNIFILQVCKFETIKEKLHFNV